MTRQSCHRFRNKPAETNGFIYELQRCGLPIPLRRTAENRNSTNTSSPSVRQVLPSGPAVPAGRLLRRPVPNGTHEIHSSVTSDSDTEDTADTTSEFDHRSNWNVPQIQISFIETETVGSKRDTTTSGDAPIVAHANPTPDSARKNSLHHVPQLQQAGEVNAAGFFLRLSVLAFGVGVLIFDGIKMGAFISDYLFCDGVTALAMLKLVLHILFTLCQMWFLFKHAKVSFIRMKTTVRLGLMHLLATNIVFWEATVMKEAEENLMNTTVLNAQTSVFEESRIGVGANLNACDITVLTMFQTLSNQASPYLYPCMIEYSLVASAITYILLTNVGKLDFNVAYSVHLTREELEVQRKRVFGKKTSFRVDCTRSIKGLFLGVTVLVCAIVSMIVFHVYNQEGGSYDQLSTDLFFYTTLTLVIILVIGVLVGLFEMRKLSYRTRSQGPDGILLYVACLAVYVFDSFNVIAAFSDSSATGRAIRLIKSLLSSGQATLQVFFIIQAQRRVIATREQEQRKPGREAVTLLLVVNIALWLAHTFETRVIYRDIGLLSFFSYLPWSIVISICAPLLIFFRFHSTICLADIWKHAYTKKKERISHQEAETHPKTAGQGTQLLS